jgi:hypothetical protein
MSMVKAGPGSHGRKDEQKEGPRPDEEAFPKGERPGKKNTVHAAQGALVKEGKERAHAREQGHDHMEIVGQVMQELDLVQLAVFQDDRNELDGQHQHVHGDAEDYFREHGVHVGMPESEPGAQRLADFQGQDQQGTGVTDETDDHRQVDDVFQPFHADQIIEKPAEKGSGTQGNDAQVER